MLERFKENWSRPQGYKEVFRVAYPLVISMGSTTAMEFTDRVFLGQFSIDAIAAATPAALAHLVLLLFFIGIVSYANVFVAQYVGAGKFDRVGPVLWQTLRIAFLGAMVIAISSFFAGPLFRLVSHAPAVQELEIIYFRVLCLGSVFALISAALSCFFSGRGLTRPIMVVNTISVLINIPLDYVLIYGFKGIPSLGIMGAGLATASAWGVQALLFSYLIFNRKNESVFKVISGRARDNKLLSQMVRFGGPAGVNMFLELSAFTFFLFVIGTIGEIELAASNIVFAINSIFFTPLMGMGIATSTLVGQAIGRGSHEEAARATKSLLHIGLAWTGLLSSLFLLIPQIFLLMFEPSTSEELLRFAEIRDLGIVLLRFVVVYCIFDTVFIIFSGAIKGAGDTRFVMMWLVLLGVFVMGLPLYYFITVQQKGIEVAWLILSAYIVSLSMLAFGRYRSGKWKHISIVE